MYRLVLGYPIGILLVLLTGQKVFIFLGGAASIVGLFALALDKE